LERNESNEGVWEQASSPNMPVIRFPRGRRQPPNPAGDTLAEITAAATRAFNASVVPTGSSRFSSLQPVPW
jgi:hypothetical protein